MKRWAQNQCSRRACASVAAVEAAVRLLLCHDHYLLAHMQRLRMDRFRGSNAHRSESQDRAIGGHWVIGSRNSFTSGFFG